MTIMTGTVEKVLAETKAQKAETAETNNTDTENKEVQSETKSGETPEFIRGIDVSDLKDVPEQYRQLIKDKLSQKLELADKGIQPKLQEVAELKRVKEGLAKRGLTADEIDTAVNDYVTRKNTPNKEAKENAKLLDQLIDKSDPETREALNQWRKIIAEESQEAIKAIREELSSFRNESISTRRDKLVSEIDGLRDKYGDELIDKYKDTLIEAGLKYKAPMKNLLHSIAPDEVEETILAKVNKGKKPLTEEKKNAITSSSNVISDQIIDIKKSSFGDLIRQGMKKK
jgi:uncharacterized protein YjgD (DUF1641 family)